MFLRTPSLLLLALLFLLPAVGCDIAPIGGGTMTVRVTAEDVATGAPLAEARLGIGRESFGFPSGTVTWYETATADARGQHVFELSAEDLDACGDQSVLVNAFSARSPDGRDLYGPRKEYLECEAGEFEVTLRMAPY